MRKTILAILMSITLIGCSKTLNEDVQQVKQNVLTEFAELIGNDIANPLLNTVWEYKMDGEYNLYLWFWSDTNVSAFYGMVEDGVLERWSPLYGWDSELEFADESFGGGPYKYIDNNNLDLFLRFPMWGDNKIINTIVAGKKDKFTLTCNDMIFEYFGFGDSDELCGIWISIFVGISPWG